MGEGKLVDEFLNTRKLSNSKYKEYTEKNTFVKILYI